MGQGQSSLIQSYGALTKAYQQLQFDYDAVEDELFCTYQSLDRARLELERKQYQAKKLRVSHLSLNSFVETI